MTQLGFSFDSNACTGCKACVVACKDVNSLPVGYKLRKVVTGEAGTWQRDAASGLPIPVDVFSYSVSYACMHCASPACMAACQQGAVRKDADTGIVWIDQAVCIGCGRCAKACPWDAPVVVARIDGSWSARKCDLCRDLLAAGEEPACVAACSMRCLRLAEFPENTKKQAPVSGETRDPVRTAGGQAPVFKETAPHQNEITSPRTQTPAPLRCTGDALLPNAPQLGPHFTFTRHRRAIKAPLDAVRVHSMPEEYENAW